MTTTPTGNPSAEGYRPTAEALLAAESPDPAARGLAIAAERDLLRTRVMTLEQENHALRGLVERARGYVSGWSDWHADADRVLLGDEDSDE